MTTPSQWDLEVRGSATEQHKNADVGQKETRTYDFVNEIHL